MPKKKCYIYTRVSTKIQVDGYSLEAQEKTLEKFAEIRDMEIVGRYKDEGKSGKDIEHRPNFKQMLKDIESHKDNVSAVLVFKLSRFGRNTRDVLNSYEILKKNDCALLCSEEPIDTSTAMGEVFLAILAAIATMERENIHAQTMAGRWEKAAQGKWNGGFAPYGYKLVDGKLEIEEDEAEIIRLIFREFVHTSKGYNGIYKYLKEKGLKKKVRHNGNLDYFSEQFVKEVLDNPIYAGKLAFGRRKQEKSKTTGKIYSKMQKEYAVYEGIHEAIIDEETWRLAQEKRTKTTQRTIKKHDLEHMYQLSGLVKCPVCGKGLVGNPSHKKKPDGTVYKTIYSYRCNQHGCTYKNQPNEERINNAVKEIVIELVNNPQFAEKMKDMIDAKVDTNELDNDIERLSEQLKQHVMRKDRLATQIDNLDILDSSYEKKVEDLEKRLNRQYEEIVDTEFLLSEAEKRKQKVLEQQVTGEIVYKNLMLFERVINQCTDLEKKTLYSILIEEIQIFPVPLENGRQIKSIKFNFPVYFEGSIVTEISRFEKTTDETVVLLSQRKADDYVEVELELDELDVTSA